MKTYYLLLIFVMLTLQSCGVKQPVQMSGNPLFEGWYADPEGIILNDEYWIFPTYSDKYEKQIFMDAFSSTDLVNWTKHERIIDNKAVKWVWRAMWAPAIVKKDNKYFLFFGGNDIQNDNEYGGIGVGVADRPEGPYQDYLGRPLIDKIYNRAQPIDQFVFQDKDGSYYMYYGGWGRCNVVKLKDDFTGLLPLKTELTTGRLHRKIIRKVLSCSFAMESTILCGRKEVGVVLTTQWLMPLQIIPLVRLSVLAKYYSKIRRLLPELDITL